MYFIQNSLEMLGYAIGPQTLKLTTWLYMTNKGVGLLTLMYFHFLADDFIIPVSCTLTHMRFCNAVILIAALDQNRLFRIADV